MGASARVESATISAANVHRASKPGSDDRAQAKNADQHHQV